MRSLIRDLLDVTRSESGTLPVAPETVDVAALVEAARTAFLRGGAQKAVEVDLPADLSRIAADGQRIVQALGTLMADEGGGVSAERLPRLFRKFSRTDAEPPSVRERGPGTGGLQGDSGGARRPDMGRERRAGTRRAVHLHDSGGRGGRRRLGRRPRSTPRRLGAGRGRLGARAVDGDPQILWHVRNTLSEAGCVPVATSDSEESDLLIEVEKPDLILLDMELPGSDEVELMRRIPQITDAPVVLLSGRGEELDIARAFEMGADDYIVKPFTPTELVARVRASLRRRGASRGAGAVEPYSLGDLDPRLRRTACVRCGPSGTADRH